MPIISGGGSGLPAQWAAASDGSMTVTITDAGGLIKLQRGSAAGANTQLGVADDGAGVEEASLFVNGKGGGASLVSVSNGSVAGTASQMDGRGQISTFTQTGLQG